MTSVRTARITLLSGLTLLLMCDASTSMLLAQEQEADSTQATTAERIRSYEEAFRIQALIGTNLPAEAKQQRSAEQTKSRLVLPETPDKPAALRLLHEIRTEDGGIQWVAFSPDNRLAACCGDRYVQTFDVATARRVRRLEGHQKDIFRFAFAPSGSMLASGSRDKTVRVWNPQNGEELAVLKAHTDRIIGVNFSADGRFLVSASANYDRSIRVWDTSSWNEVAMTKAPANTNAMYAAFSPNGSLLATSGYRGTIRTFAFDGESLTPAWEEHHDRGEMLPHIVFAPDGQTLVSSGWDKTLRLWTHEGQEVWRVKAPPYARCFEAAAFSPDGRVIYTATRDETLQAREAATGVLLSSFRWHDDGLRGFGVSANGKLLLTGGRSQRLKVWQIEAR